VFDRFSAVEGASRLLATVAGEKHGVAAATGKPAPYHPNVDSGSVPSLDLNVVGWVAFPLTRRSRRKANGFSRLRQQNRGQGVSFNRQRTTNPDQEVGNSARISKTLRHHPRREAGDELAIHPVAFKASTEALVHRLIPVTAFSREIPATRCVFNERVKICASKSPLPTDDATFKFSSLHVFAQRTRTQP